MGFEVWGWRFGVWGLGSGVRGSGFGARGAGFGVRGVVFGVWGLGVGVSGVGLRIGLPRLVRPKIQSWETCPKQRAAEAPRPASSQNHCRVHYRGTSLIRNRSPLEPNSSLMPRAAKVLRRYRV